MTEVSKSPFEHSSSVPTAAFQSSRGLDFDWAIPWTWLFSFSFFCQFPALFVIIFLLPVTLCGPSFSSQHSYLTLEYHIYHIVLAYRGDYAQFCYTLSRTQGCKSLFFCLCAWQMVQGVCVNMLGLVFTKYRTVLHGQTSRRYNFNCTVLNYLTMAFKHPLGFLQFFWTLPNLTLRWTC